MDSTTLEVAYTLDPFLRVYKDGTVERLMGTEIAPPSILDPNTGIESKDVEIAPEIGVAARLYKPRTSNPDLKLPLLVYFHGGAFFTQSAFSPTYQNFLNLLASQANSIIVSVDYRKAPEHPLPTGYDDSWTAVKWVASHSGGHGDEPWLRDHADFDRLFFAGDSAGANISHRLALRVGSDGLGGAILAGIVLMHPYFWGKDPVAGEATDLQGREILNRFWVTACPSSTGLDDPWINPVVDPNFSRVGCRRVLVYVAERDVLKYRGRLYCEALGKSGWEGEVEIVETEGEEHVFHLETPNSEKAAAMVKKMSSFMNHDKSSSL